MCAYLIEFKTVTYYTRSILKNDIYILVFIVFCNFMLFIFFVSKSNNFQWHVYGRKREEGFVAPSASYLIHLESRIERI